MSHAVQRAEARYTKLEKCILAVVISSRRLRPYFQAHQVIVLTDLPLRSALATTDVSGRMMKFTLELSGYGIRYEPREAIKAEALADFVNEYAGP